MASSRFIEEESGTYSGQIRHAHNGYFAGDFSRVPRTGSGLSAAYTTGRVAPRTQAQAQINRPQAAQLVPGTAVPAT